MSLAREEGYCAVMAGCIYIGIVPFKERNNCHCSEDGKNNGGHLQAEQRTKNLQEEYKGSTSSTIALCFYEPSTEKQH